MKCQDEQEKEIIRKFSLFGTECSVSLWAADQIFLFLNCLFLSDKYIYSKIILWSPPYSQCMSKIIRPGNIVKGENGYKLYSKKDTKINNLNWLHGFWFRILLCFTLHSYLMLFLRIKDPVFANYDGIIVVCFPF